MAEYAMGMVGLGVMGRNLSFNMEEKGFSVAAYDAWPDPVDRFNEEGKGKQVAGFKDAAEFVKSLRRPRRILLLIKAGAVTDKGIASLLPHLEKGDIIVDSGNEHFRETERRAAELEKHGIRFFGMGVSGGEEGARHGPSMMPGGDRAAYDELAPVFTKIAAQVADGPCVTYCGPGGAGHYVKMVHNGIEYGDMQIIAETYDVMHRGLGLSTPQAGAVFEEWNRGPLESFLVDLTAHVCRVVDAETGQPLVDVIQDKAGQKGTGKWTAQVALDLAVPIPTIGAAIDARVLSSMKDQRVAAQARYAAVDARAAFPGLVAKWQDDLRDALQAARVCSYAQGMALIAAGSTEYKWNINLAEMARIWKGGCIIRARLLDPVRKAFTANPALPNLLVDEGIAAELQRAAAGWRRAVAAAAAGGIPVPAIAASLAYYDSYRTARLPQNVTQAQRDAFGAHKFERVERPGFVHADWGL